MQPLAGACSEKARAAQPGLGEKQMLLNRKMLTFELLPSLN